MSEPSKVKLSDIRLSIARAVAQGLVSYTPALAEWHEGGGPITGWRGRSLREMRSEGLVRVSYAPTVDASVTVVATLSDAAAAALAEVGAAAADEGAPPPTT